MKFSVPPRLLLSFTALLLAVISFLPFKALAQTDTYDAVHQLAQAITKDSRTSQQKINGLSDATDKAFREYRQVLKEVEGLKVYNSRLEKQIDDQYRRIAQIEQAISDAVSVQRQLPPLGIRMIDVLEQLIALDVPFHSQEREQRIELLRLSQKRSDVSTAEKFRQVLEAYKIENEYGRKIDTYKDSIQLGDSLREVNILRIGRIALLYQTTDGLQTGVWNQSSKSWQPLTQRAYRSSVLQGLRIARKQAAIELMRVPVPAPQPL